MTLTADPTALALAPLRAELLRAARAEADALLAGARSAAEGEVAAARAEADRLLEAARAAGSSAGRTAAAARLAEARSQARARELTARSELFTQLRREVADRLLRLRTQPGYPGLREELAARARRLLGADVMLTEQPGGGLVATASGRRLDLSLAALAEEAVALSATSAAKLWAP